MQIGQNSRLDIPDSLRRKFLEFRRRLRFIKLTEAICGATAGVLAGYLLMYLLDRLFDTPAAVRWGIFVAAILSCGLVPAALHRWIWRRRRLDQLARLLARKHPSVGDQLLGIIELSQNESEQARSPVLVEAAIRQVAEVAERRDFSDAVPKPRHKQRLIAAAALAIAAVALLVVTTSAATNAWTRFLAPWSSTPRYTFAAVQPSPDRMIVPHGEPFSVSVRLTDDSVWKPAHAEIRLPGHDAITAPLQNGKYEFELPAQIGPTAFQLVVGDYSRNTAIEPMLRPELSGLMATIELPSYLKRPAAVTRDVRGGALSSVRGSGATFVATVSRDLDQAAVDGRPRRPQSSRFSTERVSIDEDRTMELSWRDTFGLEGGQPFAITVTATEDEAPSLVCENLPRQKVLLDSEVVAFAIRARDDFGVKQVGIEWEGLDASLPEPAKGERVIGAGGPEAEALELAATFSAKHLGITPQPIAMRVYADDFRPGRERVYSPVCYFDVLDAEQHAIWITAQLGRWHRMSLEVRDRELQLHETNQELRLLSSDELDDPHTRRRIETQAAAERSNARRLTNLTRVGDELLKQAMRNPEIGVGHLERWAETMLLLKDIAGNRMPSVADLLKDAATAEKIASNLPANGGPKAGQVRAGGTSEPKKAEPDAKPPAAVPTIADVESTMLEPKSGEPKSPRESKGSQPRLTLPTTMLAGGRSGDQPPPSAGQKVDDAVREQQDLLAEFEKIADELNTVLANLEGSTLVKRLKAASRKQQQVATKLGSLAGDVFGAPTNLTSAQTEIFGDLSAAEEKSSVDASNIMDDMSAFFDRSRYARFKVVLDDMREQDVTAGLRELSDELGKESGLSIAQAEYWSETFDRWAEDLVEVTKCGACPGCKSKGSLPPSIVLEVLQVLEAEVNLREETRVAEQARDAIPTDEHAVTGERLSQTQEELRNRIDKVVERIREIPEGEVDFAKEIALLGRVSQVMDEATDILATPDTGSRAIAAETEAIELLLQSKRFNPNGGGGGGANPGGGGGGSTTDSALALVGGGVNEKGERDESKTTQATGSAGRVLPEEFRAGLDEYFNRLESR